MTEQWLERRYEWDGYEAVIRDRIVDGRVNGTTIEQWQQAKGVSVKVIDREVK